MDLHRHSPVFLARLSNTKLLARVKHLARGERQATAVLIAHLAELDERRLYLAEGYSSLFTYCTLVLHLSEHAAYHRIEAARAARRFPVLLERLTDGSVTLTTIKLLSPHLTSENYRVLLARAQHQSRRVVEELVAELRPQPPVPAEVRRLPVPKRRRTPTGIVVAQTGFMPQTDPPKGVEGEDVHLSAPRSPRPVSAGQKQTTITPLSPQHYRIQFTASGETYVKLRRAQALLRHQIPDGDVPTIIDRALTALLEQVAKQKVAATDRPRPTGEDASTARSRHIPNAVKRAVWIRDGGRCAFVGRQGRRCSEDGFLEFHHVRPYAGGGEATPENIQLRCRSHNVHEAELYFGPRNAAGMSEERPSCSSYQSSTLSGRAGEPRVVSVSNSAWTELGWAGAQPTVDEKHRPVIPEAYHPEITGTLLETT